MKYFIHLPMKMEPIVSSETSAIRTQTPGNYPKRNNLQEYVNITIKIYKLGIKQEYKHLETMNIFTALFKSLEVTKLF